MLHEGSPSPSRIGDETMRWLLERVLPDSSCRFKTGTPEFSEQQAGHLVERY
ncbi:MAG: hypothetical protein ACTSUE_00570 [Promethearchaeota archaeon]